MHHVTDVTIHQPTPDEWSALATAFEYIGQVIRAYQDMDPTTLEDNFMGRYNPVGDPTNAPGQLIIRRVDPDKDGAFWDLDPGEEMVLMIEWPDTYQYPIVKFTNEGVTKFEVREA